MKISRFTNSLLPRIETKMIEKDLDDARAELRDMTLPPFESAKELMDDREMKQDWTKDFEKEFDKEVPTRLRGNYIVKTHEILKKASETIDTLEKMIDRSYSKDLVRTAITYQQAQLLQLVSSISFASRYARKLLIHTLGMETTLYRQNEVVGKELTPKEVQWLEDNRKVFFTTMRTLDHKPKDLEKKLEEIPDVEVNEDNEENVAASVGMSTLNPFNMIGFSVVLNPIYHIRVQYTEWRVARHEAAKEEKKMLEYQILDLKKALDEQHDPKLEQALEYTQNRVAKLNYKISKLEDAA